MHDCESFAEWRGGIESRVSTLEVTVEREAWARARMDTDMSDLKIQFKEQGRLLKALSEKQSEHTEMLRDHTEMLRDHTEMLRDHTARLTRLEAGVQKVDAGIKLIIGLLAPDGDSEPDGSDSGDS